MVLRRAILLATLFLVFSATVPTCWAQRRRRQRGETHMTNQQELEQVEKLEEQAAAHEAEL